MSSKAKGKIIDKWVLNIEGTEVTIPVRMIAGSPTTFRIDCQYGEFHYCDENPNIDELKFDLTFWLNDITTFQFKIYYYVSFNGIICRPATDLEVGKVNTSLEWRTYDIGITSVGIEMYHDNSEVLNNGSWIEGRPKIGIVDQFLCALVPATPENEAALNMLSKVFDDLHAKLRTFLAPGIIEEGFAKMITDELNLLRGPDGS